VVPVLELKGFLEKYGSDTRIIASLEAGAAPLREVLAKAGGAGKLVILIGPEGDFSPEEYAESLVAGCSPVSLGSAVLRSETAAIYCLAAAKYAFT
jgi:16S rRNA (uracil1498-N3)-methyltransferase